MSLLSFHFQPPVIAHRGVRAQAPENTLASFRLVPDAGARWVETDVKLTHDGVPILMHDDTLDRTTTGFGPVADMTWMDIQALDAGSWFSPAFAHEPVPLMTDAIRYVLDHKLRLNLEIKPCPGRTQATVMVAMIEAAKIWSPDFDPPLISSFDVNALIIASRLHPDWPRGLLLEEWKENWPELVKMTDASAIHIAAGSLTEARVKLLKDSGLPILAYTVNDPKMAKSLLHWGVAAVFSDNPGEIITAL